MIVQEKNNAPSSGRKFFQRDRFEKDFALVRKIILLLTKFSWMSKMPQNTIRLVCKSWACRQINCKGGNAL